MVFKKKSKPTRRGQIVKGFYYFYLRFLLSKLCIFCLYPLIINQTLQFFCTFLYIAKKKESQAVALKRTPCTFNQRLCAQQYFSCS